jgi:hypothetical protein
VHGRAWHHPAVMFATLSKIAVGLFAVPATCGLLCTLGVQPVRGWMMRHHCPLATHMTHEPSRPMDVPGSTMP